MRTILNLSIVCVSLIAVGLVAADDGVRSASQAYVKAFNERNPEALAALWSPDAVYTNRQTGEQVVGREAIAEQFTELFAGSPASQLTIDIDSVQLVSPNVAVEQGIASIIDADGQPLSVDYSAVYVRRDGTWLLDRLTDDPKPIVRSNYEHLKELEWMIGTWVDGGEGATITTECSWTKNQNFIRRSFTVTTADQIELSGMQIIGWDPAAQQIRSWTFDSDGGFGSGQWTKHDNRWYIRKRATTADGETATAVNILTILGDDSFALRSTQRSVGGELLPNIDEVVVVRR